MNEKKLIGMAVALALLAGVALIQNKKFNRRHSPPTAGRKTLLEGIDLNAVSGIEVSKGSNSVVLAKEDGVWKSKDLSGYPVDFKKLANAVRAVADVKTGEPVRTGNVAESEFGFGKPEQRTIALESAGQAVATLEVGARRNPSGSAGWASQYFVRIQGDEAIYLVDYAFRPFSEKPEDWIVRQILDVRSADIVSVKAGDVELKLDGADWTLADLDPEKEEFQSSEASKMRSALQYLNCTTIADKSKTDAEMGFANAVEFVAQTKDGFTYTATLGGQAPDGGRYARFAVAYARPAAPSDEKEKEAFEKTCAANQKKADELNAKLRGWTYQIGASDAADFAIPRSQIAKPKEEAKTEDKEEQ